jgi:hypothetical protein
MIIAIDDEFVVPIPKLAKVVGFFRPEALTDVAPGVRESVAEQLEHAHSGWNAVATAASGQVGVELGASSEQSAIDRAMSACSKQDSGCRIAVLGPFMVEPAAPAAALNSPSTP